MGFISSPEHKVLKVSFCDGPLSVVHHTFVRPSVRKMKLSKIFLSETTRPKAFIFGIKHHLEVLYQSCSNYAPWVKIDPAQGSQFYVELYNENFKHHLYLNH